MQTDNAVEECDCKQPVANVLVLTSASDMVVDCIEERLGFLGGCVAVIDSLDSSEKSLGRFDGPRILLVDVDSYGARAFRLAEKVFCDKLSVYLFSLKSIFSDKKEKDRFSSNIVRFATAFTANGVDSVEGESDRIAEWGIVAPNGKQVTLSVYEFLFLKFLHENVGQPVSRDSIAQALGREKRFTGNRLEALVSRLRRKMAGACPGWAPIRAVHGYGYAMRFDNVSFSQ